MRCPAALVLAFLLTAGCSALTGDMFVASGEADAGVAPTSGARDASPEPLDARTPVEASSPVDSAAPPSADSSTGDASPDANDAGAIVQVTCGADPALSCAAPRDVCCIAHGSGATSCARAGACEGTSASCSARDDCAPSMVCCGAYDRALKRYEVIRCAATCTREDDAGFEVVFCASSRGDADCAIGEHCIPSTVYRGFSVCG